MHNKLAYQTKKEGPEGAAAKCLSLLKDPEEKKKLIATYRENNLGLNWVHGYAETHTSKVEEGENHLGHWWRLALKKKPIRVSSFS